MTNYLKTFIAMLTLSAGAAVAWYWLGHSNDTRLGAGFVSGNGRIEATEIAVATKLAGRVDSVLVREGEFVRAGQPLAQMGFESLQAEREEALARRAQAKAAVHGAEVGVVQRESDHKAALALVAQRDSELDAATRRLTRSERLAREGFLSGQTLDDDRANEHSSQAAVAAALAQAKAAEVAISAARSQVSSAFANVKAIEATIERIDVELADSELKAPRDGRVQYLLAHAGEVLAVGGRILNLIDLSDVYMTFFLPETVVGRVALGSEVRIVLDAATEYVIPAKVSFVSSVAQFTPKTVETASERQKLMFRVRAQIDRDLLLKHLAQVKTGLPGVAWLKLDPDAQWPDWMAIGGSP